MVIDASALVAALIDEECRREFAGIVEREPLAAPDLIDAELVSAARRLVRGGVLSPDGGRRMVEFAIAAPIRRFPCASLAVTAWERADGVSADDAFYLALALRLDETLITEDRRLARGCRGLVTTVGLRP